MDNILNGILIDTLFKNPEIMKVVSETYTINNKKEDIIDDIIDINRPFFSIIIPCYNSKPERIRELFDSIVKAGCNDITEIIISDDRSTDKSYLEVVKEYNNLNIKIIYVPEVDELGNELIHCPGNTREYGVNRATGKWIIFVDHDDVLAENALSDIKQYILDTREKYLVASRIRVYNTVTEEEYFFDTPDDTVNWMHGKFYNLDNFWKSYCFHFVTNIKSGEDVAICSRVRCILHSLNLEMNFFEEVTYTWRKWPDSLSNTRCKFGDAMVQFHYEYFDDFFESTIEVFVNEYNKIDPSALTDKDIEFYKFIQADVILYMYFYIQIFKYTYGNSFNTFLEAKAKKYIHEFLDRFRMFPCVLYDYVCAYRNNGYDLWFTEVKKSVRHHMGYFIETDTFYDFISK